MRIYGYDKRFVKRIRIQIFENNRWMIFFNDSERFAAIQLTQVHLQTNVIFIELPF